MQLADGRTLTGELTVAGVPRTTHGLAVVFTHLVDGHNVRMLLTCCRRGLQATPASPGNIGARSAGSVEVQGGHTTHIYG